MNHTDYEILIEKQVAAEISTDEQSRLESHLTDCQACTDYARKAQRLARVLKGEPIARSMNAAGVKASIARSQRSTAVVVVILAAYFAACVYAMSRDSAFALVGPVFAVVVVGAFAFSLLRMRRERLVAREAAKAESDLFAHQRESLRRKISSAKRQFAFSWAWFALFLPQVLKLSGSVLALVLVGMLAGLAGAIWHFVVSRPRLERELALLG